MPDIRDILSKVISIVCYPLLMPTYGMALYCIADSDILRPIPTAYKWIIIAATLVFTCIIPLSLIIYMVIRGQIKDLYLENAQERNTPYLYTIVGYGVWCYFLYSVLKVPLWMLLVAIGATMALLVVWIVNKRWKISAHLTGMGGLLGGLLSYSLYYAIFPLTSIVVMLFLSLALMYARIWTGAHNAMQVVVGYLLGLVLTVVPYWIIELCASI